MTHIPEARITLITCTRCGQLARGPHGAHTCLACIGHIREQYRCPDCDSIVTIALTADDGDAVFFADVRHDDTCPTWSAYCRDNNNSDHHDIMRGPFTS